jgi:hypothetical protein
MGLARQHTVGAILPHSLTPSHGTAGIFTDVRSTLINADIGPSTNLNWVATIWTIGSAIGFLLVGRLSDIFGRKWMVMGTSFLGLLGCIVGGTAKNIDTLVGANLMNGIGAAGQLSFGIVLGELVPNKHRGPIVTLVFVSSLPFAGKLGTCSFARRTFANGDQSLAQLSLARLLLKLRLAGDGRTTSVLSLTASPSSYTNAFTSHRHTTSSTSPERPSSSSSKSSTLSASSFSSLALCCS